MYLDDKATREAPNGWEIWTTQTRWQAQKQGCIEGDKSTYGELRKYPELAIKDASEKSME